MGRYSMPRTIPANVPYGEMRIPAEVKKAAKKIGCTHSATRWLTWFEEGEYGGILARTFAYKSNKTAGTHLLECMREYVGGALMLIRHMYYGALAGWQCWFPAENEIVDMSWRDIPVSEIPGIWLEIVNVDKIFEVEEFKYCGWQKGLPCLEYLRAYKDNPGVEFFGRIGIMPRKSLVNKAIRDGNFRKWLRGFPKACEKVETVNMWGPQAILDAYKAHSYDVAAAYYKANEKRQLQRKVREYGGVQVLKAGFSAERIINYLKNTKDGLQYHLYADYIHACEYLHIDLRDTKNAFPNDLRRMHDLRANEMASEVAKKDAKERRSLYLRFYKAAKDLKWCETETAAFCIIVPFSPNDLVKEGKKLHHCVGKMGYDKKMADGKSFIAFLRRPDKKDVPFVTIEFDLQTNAVKQCYGDHDSKPEQTVMDFVNEWAATVKMHLLEEKRREEKERKREEAKALRTALQKDDQAVAAG